MRPWLINVSRVTAHPGRIVPADNSVWRIWMARRARVVAGWLGWGVVTLTAATALAQSAPERQAFFGQTHSHTSWSLDAYIIGNHITGPEDAYKFSLGQAV